MCLTLSFLAVISCSLCVLYIESKEEKVVLTHFQLKSNVPFDRLKAYIAELKELYLIAEEPSVKLIDKTKCTSESTRWFLILGKE
jgi:hypothetical protein